MDYIRSNRRTDAQLEAILGETGHWSVRGQQGQTLGFAPSLKMAVERAAAYAASGAVVVDLSRLPFDNIVVVSPQIDRLRNTIMAREAEDWPDAEVLSPAAKKARG